MTRIGMIGIGRMGLGIASNLVRHGRSLMVLDHPGNQPLDSLRAAGVTTRATPAALAAEADVLILCVTGTPEVEAVLMGDQGVLEALRPGTVVIDCSTAVPASTERLASAVVAAGGRFLDAPMTRTPKEAAEGRLNLLIGADAALLDECRPILACFAENIIHAGPVGAGHRMKLVHNYVSLGSVALLAEAAACAAGAGVDAGAFVQALTLGGGWGAALERLKPYLANGDTSGMLFTVANAHKDLGYYNRMADEAGADRTVAAAIERTLAQASRDSGPQTVMPELVTLIGARAGKTLPRD